MDDMHTTEFRPEINAELREDVTTGPSTIIWEFFADYFRNHPTLRLPSIQTPDFGDSGGLEIFTDGRMKLSKPFRWDMCSPRFGFYLFGKKLFTIGTPNGKGKDGKPKALIASMVHDALCRFAPSIALQTGLDLDDIYHMADMEFRRILSRDWHEVRDLYFWAVAKFGRLWRRIG